MPCTHASHAIECGHEMKTIIISISLLFRMIVSGVRATLFFPISAAGQLLLCVSAGRGEFLDVRRNKWKLIYKQWI